MKTLDRLIKDAQDALGKTEKDTPAQAAAQATLDALNSVKEAGYTKTQDDLNRLDKQVKESYENRIKESLRMTLEEFDEVMAGVEESLSDAGAGGDGAGDGAEGGNTLERFQSALGERDQAIKDEREARLKFERELRTERITNRLNDQLKGLGLNEKYENPARRLIGYEDLIEKAMSGEEVTDEELKAKAEAAKAEAPVFFEAEQNTDWQGIPPSPEGTPPEQITDEQRRQLSDPIF